MPTSEGAVTFGEWVDSLPEDERAAVSLCDAWNAGVRSACQHFVSVEGVDHGAEKELVTQGAGTSWGKTT